MSIRPIKRVIEAKPTVEGAGVKLRRAFGFGDTADFDPFLLFDDFRNENPDDYLAGFPWHPHRGIETITYGRRHGRSQRQPGQPWLASTGDVQWMTAGSGILHRRCEGRLRTNARLFAVGQPATSSLKMTTPHSQDVLGADIPVTDDDGTRTGDLR
jgi:redox-sensitive bicupin YhaK (pirin superfamily)